MNRPTIITLIGSTKFHSEFDQANMELTLAGNIVISCGLFGHDDYPPGAREATKDGDEGEEIKQMLDALHMHKINLADEVHVICPGNYVGSSTKREIAYARASKKQVTFRS